MARLARVIPADTPYHVTQRGNARQIVFHSDADRIVYLDLLRANSQNQQLSLTGYCLMSNHVHLIVIPRRLQALPLALKHTHGRYATYRKKRVSLNADIFPETLPARPSLLAMPFVTSTTSRAGLPAPNHVLLIVIPRWPATCPSPSITIETGKPGDADSP